MKRILSLFFRKKSMVTGIACLFILVLVFFVSPSWAAYESSFPDNTVFEVYEFENGFYGPDGTNGWGTYDQLFIVKETFTFMSDGTFTATYSNDDEILRNIGDDTETGNNTFTLTAEESSGTDSGTYEISSDGEITVTFDTDPGEEDDEDEITGTLSEDGNTVIFGYSEYSDSLSYSSFGFGVGVKKGSGFSSDYLDNTEFTVGEFESGFYGSHTTGDTDQVFIIKTTISFGSNGSVTINIDNDDGLTRIIGDDSETGNNTFSTSFTQEGGDEVSGNYTISSDGTVDITFQEDEETVELTGVLSGDGQTFIFAYSDIDNPDNVTSGFFGIGVGIRRGTDYSRSYPNGYFTGTTVFATGEFESGFHGPDGTDTGGWGVNNQLFIVKETFKFMSDGTFTAVYSNDDSLNRFIGDDPETGYNTFTTTYTPSEGTDSGTYSISSDGTVIVTFDSEPDDEDEITGILSEDGKTVIFAYSDSGSMYGSMGIGVGVKVPVESYPSENNNSLISILPLLLEE
jgi:hypothetical protein